MKKVLNGILDAQLDGVLDGRQTRITIECLMEWCL